MAPYTPGILVDPSQGKLLFVSGQVGLEEDGKTLVQDDVKRQTERALARLDLVLKEAGASREHLVDVQVLLTTMEHYAPMNEVYGAYFKGHVAPARAAYAVAALPLGALVEIKSTAFIPNKSAL